MCNKIVTLNDLRKENYSFYISDCQYPRSSIINTKIIRRDNINTAIG